MSKLKYDPELPYTVVSLGEVRARARYEDEAELFASLYLEGYVIDTTPKPKIPKDAQHITWGKSKVAYSRYYDGLWYGWNHGRGLSDQEILKWIGDAEVTVLVRKEET